VDALQRLGARPYHLEHLKKQFGSNLVQGIYTVVNGFITLGLMGLVAFLTKQPYLFPSLGPTALILFVTPMAAVAAPRNVIYAHAIGAAAGYAALLVTGLEHAPPTFIAGVTSARIVAAALALAATGGFTVWLNCQHPPAGATTLIVALGIMTHPASLFTLMLAVSLLVLQAIGINRLAGVPYPLWDPVQDDRR
jgi:CBS-domain-containing membrane protein